MAMQSTSGVAPNWRDTYRPARLFIFDARLLFLVLPTLLYFRTATVGLTIVVALFLYYFEKRRSMDVPSSLRLLRSAAAGPVRPGRSRMKQRGAIDYERVDRAAALRSNDP